MMRRRTFLGTLAALPAMLAAQEGPPPAHEPVEQMTATPRPAIGLNHLGFRPGTGEKVLVVKASGAPGATAFELRDIGSEPFHLRRELRPQRSDFGPVLTADFSDVQRPGMYQISVRGTSGTERSVPFFIREDVWRRTLPKVAGYYRAQRCGVEAPGFHPVCHLDDGRRRDTGEHVDVVGGWHDAGDLRKWMEPTMLNGVALLQLRRNLAAARPSDPTGAELLEEFRHGNRYFLKMQDTDGRVWFDTAGGVNGDNSDNHWTDNVTGSDDDRYINTKKVPLISAMFAALQAMAAQAWRESGDAAESARCLQAAERAWRAWPRQGATVDLAWWTLAACELRRATGDASYAQEAQRLGHELLTRQQQSFDQGQTIVRGYWLEGGGVPAAPLVNIMHSAMPALALLELYAALPAAPERRHWLDAVRMYADDYLQPLTERNAYRIVPTGLYYGTPTPETYRPLAGHLTYRYFLPARKQFWWQGANCHLAAHALLLGRLAEIQTFEGKEEAGRPYGALAYRQLEWIVGANPFGSCLMTGEGMRNPFPHSRYVGLIPGGIMNGIAGNANDEPVLDLQYGFDWRTCEYWSPHVAYYLWAVSTLEKAGREPWDMGRRA